jgi:LemA protein
MESVFGVLLLIGLALLAWYVSTKNRFAWLENLVRESWSGIDVQLKRRYDLIPNLVETVKGYAQHEERLFEAIARAREASASAQAVGARSQSDQELTGAVTSLLARVEAYPELKASRHFLELQQELSLTEDRIAAARRFYNANVRDYNAMLQSFPASLLAGNRKAAEYYQCDEIRVPHIAPGSFQSESGRKVQDHY